MKEQLQLFGSDASVSPAKDFPVHIPGALNKREKLTALLEGELNFHGEDSGYASHDFHSFAAKFPPQLPRTFIRGLTNPGDVVLDLMMGSGTTVVEALLEGRQAIGIDIDPLALSLGRGKTMSANPRNCLEVGNTVLVKASRLLSEGGKVEESLRLLDERTKAFVDYWFLPATQGELMALVLAIRDVADETIRRFLELTLSSIIVTKSGGVSRARDLAHSRPHLDKSKVPKNALESFSIRLQKNLSNLHELKRDHAVPAIIAGDARLIPLVDGVIDLIVTSPPYANAIDYIRAHKFSLVWLGMSMSDLAKLRPQYIGSENIGQGQSGDLPERPSRILKELEQLDQRKSAVLRKYFVEMKIIFSEMHRVLRSDSPAIVVVGKSTMRGMDVQTHDCLADIAVELGFDVVGVKKRTLDRNKRMMPARFGKKTDSQIEQRMHDEYVIGLLKPPLPKE